MEKKTLVFDIECYTNYFLVMFRNADKEVARAYEMFDGQELDVDTIRRILTTYKVVSFNGNSYDIPMLCLALRGASCQDLKRASDNIIEENLRGWQFEQQYDVKPPVGLDHIDLIEVAFGQGSLKLYGGRLHSQKLQDLPIEPSALISPRQRKELIEYCENDLQTTIDLWKHLQPQIRLREKMTLEFGEDLRSKSDAQVAEAVIKREVSKILGEKISRPEIRPGTTFQYTPPEWLRFQTPILKDVMRDVVQAVFCVSDTGAVTMPETLDGRSVQIGDSVYRMGIGGLHSSEQNQCYVSTDEYALIDRDVASYYPAIIINGKLSPHHLKREDAFLRVYSGLVKRRLEAKRVKDEVVSSALKISINGSFGKLGSKYSTLYSPHLMIQVTVTGQLALLMLIEALEKRGIRVISGNTDGIVIHCHRDQEELLGKIVKWWEGVTAFDTEETRYKAVFSRDVNNYIALKEHGGSKGKGAFAPVSISKNPQNTICVEAVQKYLEHGVPVEDTIRACTDIRKFVTVRTVRGGAVKIEGSSYNDALTPGAKKAVLQADNWYQVKEGALSVAKFDVIPDGCGYDVETAYRIYCGEDSFRYLGKVVRFYIGRNAVGALHYMVLNKSGGRNKVPSSDGAVPVMQLPDTLPSDIDYSFYINEANSILKDLGATPEKVGQVLYGESADLFI